MTHAPDSLSAYFAEDTSRDAALYKLPGRCACEARSSRVVDESSPCHPFACRTGWMLPETRLGTAMCRLVSIKPSANFHGVLYNRFVR